MLIFYDLFRVLMALFLALFPIWSVFLIYEHRNKKTYLSNCFWIVFFIVPWILVVVYFLPPTQQLFERYLPVFYISNPTLPVHMEGQSVVYLRYKIYREGYIFSDYGWIVMPLLSIWFMGSLYAGHNRRRMLDEINGERVEPFALIGSAIWWFHPLMRKGFRCWYEGKQMLAYDNKEPIEQRSLSYYALDRIETEQKRRKWIMLMMGLVVLLLLYVYDGQREDDAYNVSYIEQQNHNFLVFFAEDLKEANRFLTKRIYGYRTIEADIVPLMERLKEDGERLRSFYYDQQKYRVSIQFGPLNPIGLMADSFRDIARKEQYTSYDIERMLEMIAMNNQWLEAYYDAEAVIAGFRGEDYFYQQTVAEIYKFDGELLSQFSDSYEQHSSFDKPEFFDFHVQENNGNEQASSMDLEEPSHFEYTYSQEQREEAKVKMATWISEQMRRVDPKDIRTQDNWFVYKADLDKEGKALTIEEQTKRANAWIDALNQPQLSLGSVSEGVTQDFNTYFTDINYEFSYPGLEDRLSEIYIDMRSDGSIYSIQVSNPGIFLEPYKIPDVFLTKEAIVSYIPEGLKDMVVRKELVIQEEPQYEIYFENEGVPFILYLDAMNGNNQGIEPELPRIKRYD